MSDPTFKEVVEKLDRIEKQIKPSIPTWLSVRQIADYLDVSEQGRRDFRLAYEKGQENGKISLRRIQFKLAERNATMGIWLGKQYLGQREMTYETSEPIDLKEFAEVIANNYEPEAT